MTIRKNLTNSISPCKGAVNINILDVNQYIGKQVIASPEHWGRYICQLLDVLENWHAPLECYRWKGKCQVIECIREPSQRTIDGQGVCNRTPYAPGEVRDFNISEMEPVTCYHCINADPGCGYCIRTGKTFIDEVGDGDDTPCQKFRRRPN